MVPARRKGKGRGHQRSHGLEVDVTYRQMGALRPLKEAFIPSFTWRRILQRIPFTSSFVKDVAIIRGIEHLSNGC